eukprot:364051-Chlamydomonas_euryale.AAC.2
MDGWDNWIWISVCVPDCLTALISLLAVSCIASSLSLSKTAEDRMRQGGQGKERWMEKGTEGSPSIRPADHPCKCVAAGSQHALIAALLISLALTSHVTAPCPQLPLLAPCPQLHPHSAMLTPPPSYCPAHTSPSLRVCTIAYSPIPPSTAPLPHGGRIPLAHALTLEALLRHLSQHLAMGQATHRGRLCSSCGSGGTACHAAAFGRCRSPAGDMRGRRGGMHGPLRLVERPCAGSARAAGYRAALYHGRRPRGVLLGAAAAL